MENNNNIKWKTKSGWKNIYSGLTGTVNGALQKAANLSDVADRITSLKNLQLWDDVSEHHHDSRYLPIIEEKVKSLSGNVSGDIESFRTEVNQIIADAKKEIQETSDAFTTKFNEISKQIDEKIATLDTKLQDTLTDINNTVEDLRKQIEEASGDVSKVIMNKYYIGETAPSSPQDNDLWFDINKGLIKYYKDGSWNIFGAAGHSIKKL